MTSTNTPAPYVVTACEHLTTSSQGDVRPWHAFNSNANTCFLSQLIEDPWIAIDLGQATYIKGVSFRSANVSANNWHLRTPKVFTIYGSNDGSNFVPLFSSTGDEYSTVPTVNEVRSYVFNSPVNYRHYKIVSHTQWGNVFSTEKIYFITSGIQFYKEIT